MSKSFVEEKYGYVEDVEWETEYKNIDYRDTTVPLWNHLQNKKKIDEKLTNISATISSQQNQTNVALCASIIQLGKYLNHSINQIYKKLNEFDNRLTIMENKNN